MNEKNLSYKNVGIDIRKTDQIKQDMADLLKTSDKRVINNLGAFASLYDLGNLEGIENPVLVLKAEEPGSKQKLAFSFGYEGSICHDMINHLINDAIVMGAKPLAVLDVIITGGVRESVINTLVKEMAIACKNNECSLVGGETSIQPGILSDDICVLSSSVVGVVDKKNIIDGSKISEGDSVLAVASNGLHTNGYTIVRKMIDIDCDIINKEVIMGKTFIQSVMEPHTAYYPIIKSIIKPESVHGMAHITGGGIEGNLKRIIPAHLEACIDLSKITTLPIFKFIKDFGALDDEEMLSTFNCGVGLILIVSPDYKDEIQKKIGASIPCYEIGSIRKTEGYKKVILQNHLNWLSK